MSRIPMIITYFALLILAISGLNFKAQGQEIIPEDLRTGDVILAHLNCFVCRAIEIEENSKYSHSGLVLKLTDNAPDVLESIHGVDRVSLKTFRDRVNEEETPILVLRPENFFETNSAEVSVQRARRWLKTFQEEYLGARFDSDYRWDNREELGAELYYCSEFIVKFLNRTEGLNLTPKAMHFDKLHDFWNQYFRGNIPYGEKGWSPEDFVRSPDFRVLGTLKH